MRGSREHARSLLFPGREGPEVPDCRTTAPACPRRGGSIDPRGSRRRPTGPIACSARASIRRLPARPNGRDWRWAGSCRLRWRWSGEPGSRRTCLRAGSGRRIRGILPGASGTLSSGSERCLHGGEGRGHSPKPGSPSGPTWWTPADYGRGDTVLVHGGASGIGTAAIGIGNALGALVFVTAGSEEGKSVSAGDLGAWDGACYRTADWPAVLKAANRRQGRGCHSVHGGWALSSRQPPQPQARRPAGADCGAGRAEDGT